MKTRITFVFVMVASFMLSFQVAAAPLSEEQGDAILNELKDIKQLLQKMNQQNRAKPAGRQRPTSARVSASAGHAIGKDDAPLTMVEFTDFQCPFCKRFHDVVFPELKKKYIDTGKLRYVSRDLPLTIHKNAMLAANAARCAGEQDKFWEFREVLFTNAKNLEPDAINGYAQALPLDMQRFSGCLESKKYEKDIDQDVRDAHAAGFTGTPSFVLGKDVDDGFVDGEAIIGAKPFPYIEDAIAKAMEED